jgi:hypothetical protein
VKAAGSFLIVSMLLGVCAALAALAIGALTGATISPPGGALLGGAFGLSGGALTTSPVRAPRGMLTIARGVLAGGTAALVVVLLRRP